MGVKYQRQRLRVDIRNDNNYTTRDEFRSCSAKGCLNIIAVWAVSKGRGPIFCTSCTRKGHR